MSTTTPSAVEGAPVRRNDPARAPRSSAAAWPSTCIAAATSALASRADNGPRQSSGRCCQSPARPRRRHFSRSRTGRRLRTARRIDRQTVGVSALFVPEASAAVRPAPARSSVRLFIECSSRSKPAQSLQLEFATSLRQSALRGKDFPEFRENGSLPQSRSRFNRSASKSANRRVLAGGMPLGGNTAWTGIRGASKVLQHDFQRAAVEQIAYLPERTVADAEVHRRAAACAAEVLSVLKLPFSRSRPHAAAECESATARFRLRCCCAGCSDDGRGHRDGAAGRGGQGILARRRRRCGSRRAALSSATNPASSLIRTARSKRPPTTSIDRSDTRRSASIRG